MATAARDELEVEVEEDQESYVTYDIATYPSDLTLSVIYDLWNAGDIVIPDYQREYVWSQKQASLLIESLLIGLPIPPVFFYIDDENRNLVIDGQQRLTSIVYFLNGFFGAEDKSKKKVFRLMGLSPRSPYLDKTLTELSESDQRKLRGAVLRAVNIRQLSPRGGATSVYHIFERLNTGGTPLKPQEIRNCVYRGPIVDQLRALNRDKNWREIVGKPLPDKHQKDVELILRLYALFLDVNSYESPMKDFLSSAMKSNRAFDSLQSAEFAERFPKIAAAIVTALGPRPFNRGGPVNTAFLEAVFVSLLRMGANIPQDFKERFETLRADSDFSSLISQSTANEKVLAMRHQIAHSVLTR